MLLDAIARPGRLPKPAQASAATPAPSPGMAVGPARDQTSHFSAAAGSASSQCQLIAHWGMPGAAQQRASTPRPGTNSSCSPDQNKGASRAHAGTPSIWNCFFKARGGRPGPTWNRSPPVRGAMVIPNRCSGATPPWAHGATRSMPPHAGRGQFPGASMRTDCFAAHAPRPQPVRRSGLAGSTAGAHCKRPRYSLKPSSGHTPLAS